MDHPRIRGEHEGHRCEVEQAVGSSPHTRGALAQYSKPRWMSGIIPAYAGSTTESFRTERISSDHPRIRGEHVSEHPPVNVVAGSSPHTRGAPTCPECTASQAGIIPAYAGSTYQLRHQQRLGADHPRIRGEHCDPETDMDSVTGSSPHTRGALHLTAQHLRVRGIIPAYAGST